VFNVHAHICYVFWNVAAKLLCHIPFHYWTSNESSRNISVSPPSFQYLDVAKFAFPFNILSLVSTSTIVLVINL
jgi:hypothetical protein